MPGRRRTSRLLAALLALAAVAPASAAAQDATPITATVSPDRIKAKSRLTVSVRDAGAAFGGQVPRDLEFNLSRGFKLDLRSAPGRCTLEVAEQGRCLRRSKVGDGEARLTTQTLLGPRQFTVAMQSYLSDTTPEGALAGVFLVVEERSSGIRRVVQGRIDAEGTGARRVFVTRFERLDEQVRVQGITATLDSLNLDVGATRRARRGRRQVTYSLLRNPARCRTNWSLRLAATFADGSERTGTLPVPCRRPRRG